MTMLPGRDRVFARALIVSAVLHLSAVTLFRIVIYFPREDTHFFNVSIVRSAPSQILGVPAPGPAGLDNLDVSGPGFGERLALQDPLPPIELPTVKFDELSLLRMRQEALQIRSRYDDVFSARGTAESWSNLTTGLDSVGETISRLTFGGPAREPDRPRPVSRPAPGFEAYVEWMSDPRDRQALDVQPISALRGLGPDALPEPITLVFRVDTDGAVVDVVDPLGDARGLVAAAAEALRGYRFEPLLGDGGPTQGGTFIVRASGE